MRTRSIDQRAAFTTLLVPALAAGALLAAAAATALHPPHRTLRGQKVHFEFSSITPAGPIESGQSGDAAVAINRYGGHTAAVALGIATNAQGITGTGTVPFNSNLGTVTLAVPAPVAPGSYWLTLSLDDGSTTLAVDFELEVVTTPTGTTTLSTERAYHTETLLPNGKVLVTGGRGASSTFLDSADLYDPVSGLVNPTGTMATRRVSHTATLLANGKVLVVGGFTSSTTGTTSAELYDPASGTFTPTGPMTRPRGTHTATVLPNGEVLVAGGFSGSRNTIGNYPATAEIYSPASGTFRDTGSLNTVRGVHRATAVYGATFPLAAQDAGAAVLEDRVLISGGYNATGFPTALEWYHVGSGTFSTLSVAMAAIRALHTAVLLPNGKVLLAGGQTSSSLPSGTGAAELYDVAANTIGPTGSLAEARGAQSSTLVNGKVIVCGGVTLSGFTVLTRNSVESYDPASGQFTTLVPPMAETRALHTATLLGNGQVLITGGAYASGFSDLYRKTVEKITLP
jgi:hypothetical protein